MTIRVHDEGFYRSLDGDIAMTCCSYAALER